MMKHILIFFVLLVLAAGCYEVQEAEEIDSTTEPSPEWNGSEPAEPIELEEVEIREYEGEKLGSVNDFRENSIRGPQKVNLDTYKLAISGMVENPQDYTYDEVLDHQSYSKVITLYCVEGWNVRLLWEGVLLKDLLEEVNVEEGANTVIFKAHDGYSTSLPLDYILENNIMLAYKQNNITLPAQNGFPFQLVAEDKAGYKWIKWVTSITLSNNPGYRGYWESRGWDNDADIR